ncbi:hypothetical protein BDQ17DRAFT_1264076, partial [Cyathus striatus]
KNPERVAAGLKATINRPNVSDEAKQRAMERLEEMGVDIEKPSRRTAHGQLGEQRVLGGYKATLKNPHVSKEAKEHAHDVLEENNAI